MTTLINAKQAAEILGWCERKFRLRRYALNFEPIKVGKRVKYDKEIVVAYAKAQSAKRQAEFELVLKAQAKAKELKQKYYADILRVRKEYEQAWWNYRNGGE